MACTNWVTRTSSVGLNTRIDRVNPEPLGQPGLSHLVWVTYDLPNLMTSPLNHHVWVGFLLAIWTNWDTMALHALVVVRFEPYALCTASDNKKKFPMLLGGVWACASSKNDDFSQKYFVIYFPICWSCILILSMFSLLLVVTKHLTI